MAMVVGESKSDDKSNQQMGASDKSIQSHPPQMTSIKQPVKDEPTLNIAHETVAVKLGDKATPTPDERPKKRKKWNLKKKRELMKTPTPPTQLHFDHETEEDEKDKSVLEKLTDFLPTRLFSANKSDNKSGTMKAQHRDSY